MIIVSIIKFLAANGLFSVVNVAFLSACHVFEDRLYLAVISFLKPIVMCIHVTPFIIIFIVES